MRRVRPTTHLTGIVFGIGFFLSTAASLPAQEAASSKATWQGTQPATPEQTIRLPVPQTPVPAGKQVLELPSRPQRPPVAPPRPQVSVRPHPQPRLTRPQQLVTVTVTDQNGGYIPGLRPGDFVVYEGERRQEITYFNTGEHEPVSLGLIVDTSDSMRSKIRHAQHALRRFVDSIKPQDEVFLAGFREQPYVLQDFTDSRVLLSQGIGMLQSRGGTSLYAAILDGLHRIARGRYAKKALVVITDGMDRGSRSSLRQVVNWSRRAGVLIYTIGIGDPHRRYPRPASGSNIDPFGNVIGWVYEGVYPKTLRRISEETGARHFLLNTRDVTGQKAVLDVAAQTISRELRLQYSIGYASSGGGNRYSKLRVQSTRPGVVVRAQQGSARQ